jgi:hypothetical protein
VIICFSARSGKINSFEEISNSLKKFLAFSSSVLSYPKRIISEFFVKESIPELKPSMSDSADEQYD